MEQNIITKTDDGKVIVRLSDSAMRAWEDCHKKFYFRRMCGLVPKERIHVFDVGTLGHIGCKTFLHPNNAQFPLQERYKMARESITNHFEHVMKPDGATKEVLDETLHVFPVIMQRRLQTTTIAVEQWWETDIVDEAKPSIIVHFVGRADALSIHEGAIYIEEHKFTSGRGFGDKRIEGYQKARQTKGYVTLAQANTRTEKKIRGVLHNFFLKMTNPKLEQRIAYVGPKDLSRFQNSVVDMAEEIVEAYENNCWRESLDECRGFYGKCPYATLCEFDDTPEVRAQLYAKHEPRDKFEILNA